MLRVGLEEIARNHGFECCTRTDDGYSPFIYGQNVPTYADVEFLCEDIGLSKDCIEVDYSFGIGIYPDREWWFGRGNEEYAGGAEWWRRQV